MVGLARFDSLCVEGIFVMDSMTCAKRAPRWVAVKLICRRCIFFLIGHVEAEDVFGIAGSFAFSSRTTIVERRPTRPTLRRLAPAIARPSPPTCCRSFPGSWPRLPRRHCLRLPGMIRNQKPPRRQTMMSAPRPSRRPSLPPEAARRWRSPGMHRRTQAESFLPPAIDKTHSNIRPDQQPPGWG